MLFLSSAWRPRELLLWGFGERSDAPKSFSICTEAKLKTVVSCPDDPKLLSLLDQWLRLNRLPFFHCCSAPYCAAVSHFLLASRLLLQTQTDARLSPSDTTLTTYDVADGLWRPRVRKRELKRARSGGGAGVFFGIAVLWSYLPATLPKLPLFPCPQPLTTIPPATALHHKTSKTSLPPVQDTPALGKLGTEVLRSGTYSPGRLYSVPVRVTGFRESLGGIAFTSPRVLAWLVIHTVHTHIPRWPCSLVPALVPEDNDITSTICLPTQLFPLASHSPSKHQHIAAHPPILLLTFSSESFSTRLRLTVDHDAD